MALTSAEDAAPGSYIDSLVHRAGEMKLHEDNYWRVLVHYKRTPGGVSSLIDDPAFFLSGEGKRNPAAELNATIRSFFTPLEEGKKHPICRFIARFYWLKEKLEIDESALPMNTCKDTITAIDGMRPRSATLVFPASHINSPASMFGHTLLTIETGNRSKLLAHSVNYSAVTTETFGPSYAIKGIFGLYRGYFGILPYYAKIQEYNDFDQRDIWEYLLNLTEDEVRRMLYHIYELDYIYSDYYFFDENCSYNLLFLLDVARPTLRLTDDFYPPYFSWVIPVDTIRGARTSGLIESVEYRPSRVTMIKHITSQLGKEGRDFAMSVIRGRKDTGAILKADLPESEKAMVCDLLTEYTRYRFSRDEITKDEYTKLLIDFLGVRSALGHQKETDYVVPRPGRPDEGHLSARFSTGGGVRDGTAFVDVKLRPSYHTLMDPDYGYIPGGHIVFTDIHLRLYNDERSARLEKFDFIDIISLSPRERLIESVSWKISTGLRRLFMGDGNEPLAAFINPGGGLVWDIPWIGLFYWMFETEFDAGRSLDNRYSLGVGSSTGILTSITQRLKTHITARNLFHLTGDKRHEALASCSLRFTASVNASLMIEASRMIAADENFSARKGENEISVGGNLFF